MYNAPILTMLRLDKPPGQIMYIVSTKERRINVPTNHPHPTPTPAPTPTLFMTFDFLEIKVIPIPFRRKPQHYKSTYESGPPGGYQESVLPTAGC